MLCGQTAWILLGKFLFVFNSIIFFSFIHWIWRWPDASFTNCPLRTTKETSHYRLQSGLSYIQTFVTETQQWKWWENAPVYLLSLADSLLLNFLSRSDGYKYNLKQICTLYTPLITCQIRFNVLRVLNNVFILYFNTLIYLLVVCACIYVSTNLPMHLRWVIINSNNTMIFL